MLLNLRMLTRTWLFAVLVGCGGETPEVTPDAPPAPQTLVGYLVAGGPVMENFVWHSSYTNCATCEELTVWEFAPDHYNLKIFTREPGQTAALHCTARFNITESAVDGFDPVDRTRIALSLGGPNDCGFTNVGVADSWVIGVATRDGAGAPSALGWWPQLNASSAATFPGYEDVDGTGLKAAPLIACPTAPGTLCEPTCDLGAVPAGGCGLPEPI